MTRSKDAPNIYAEVCRYVEEMEEHRTSISETEQFLVHLSSYLEKYVKYNRQITPGDKQFIRDKALRYIEAVLIVFESIRHDTKNLSDQTHLYMPQIYRVQFHLWEYVEGGSAESMPIWKLAFATQQLADIVKKHEKRSIRHRSVLSYLFKLMTFRLWSR